MIYRLEIDKKKRKQWPDIAIIICGIVFLFFGEILLGIAPIIFGVIGLSLNRKSEVVISEEKIIYPSFMKKEYQWQEIDNMLLKDNLLTIDMKNNKLIQVKIRSFAGKEIEETGLNNFCRKMLSSIQQQ